MSRNERGSGSSRTAVGAVGRVSDESPSSTRGELGGRFFSGGFGYVRYSPGTSMDDSCLRIARASVRSEPIGKEIPLGLGRD